MFRGQQKQKITQIRRETETRIKSIRSDARLKDLDKETKIREAREEGHERVMGVLTPQQTQEFHEWLKYGPRMGAGPAAKSDPSPGQAVYAGRCAGCHGADGNKPSGWRAAVQKMSPAQVEQVVRAGTKGMPAYGKLLTAEQIQQVSAYSKQLAAGGR